MIRSTVEPTRRRRRPPVAASLGQFVLATLLGLTLTLPGRASAQAFDVVLDLAFSNLDLSGATRISGTDRAIGAVYQYDGVTTLGPDRVDARLTIVNIVNASIAVLDGTTNPARFEPSISTGSSGGYVEFALSFFVGDEPVGLQNFYGTGVDIDGTSSTNREYHEIGGFADYTVDASTQLTVIPGVPLTRIQGRSTSLDGITFDDTASYIARFTTPTHTLMFRMGSTGSNSTARLHSLAVGALVGTFTNPVLTEAPGVSLSTPLSIVDEPFIVTATFDEPVSGVELSDFAVGNGAPSSLTGSGAVYQIRVTPVALGDVSIVFLGGRATSIASGLPNSTSTPLLVTFAECTSDADCDDGNECTTDRCGAAGLCSNAARAAGSSCTGGF
jgi:hypothetical protein